MLAGDFVFDAGSLHFSYNAAGAHGHQRPGRKKRRSQGAFTDAQSFRPSSDAADTPAGIAADLA